MQILCKFYANFMQILCKLIELRQPLTTASTCSATRPGRWWTTLSGAWDTRELFDSLAPASGNCLVSVSAAANDSASITSTTATRNGPACPKIPPATSPVWSRGTDLFRRILIAEIPHLLPPWDTWNNYFFWNLNSVTMATLFWLFLHAIFTSLALNYTSVDSSWLAQLEIFCIHHDPHARSSAISPEQRAE